MRDGICIPWFIVMAAGCAAFWASVIWWLFRWWLFRIPGRMVLA